MRDIQTDKLTYMMGLLDETRQEVTIADIDEFIFKIIEAAQNCEYGYEANLIAALVDARNTLAEQEAEDDEIEPGVSRLDAENRYVEKQIETYREAGYADDYAQESASWPDVLPLDANWPVELLDELARQDVVRQAVVHDQIRREMQKRQELEQVQNDD